MSIKLCVFIVDDDDAVCNHLRLILESAGLYCQTFESAEQFLDLYSPGTPGCLLLDVYLPGLDGIELQAELTRRNIRLPIIFITAYGDIPMTVQAMKAGAADFLTKPVPSELLIERVLAFLQQEVQLTEPIKEGQDFRNRMAKLTSREREILPMVLSGIPNKDIAQQKGISYRTVERHRIRILKKTGVPNFLALARLCEIYNIMPNILLL